jgi:prepilin-type N-terminal cleavage/methylation domain-containing protein
MFSFLKYVNNKKGFTLIEITLVLAVAALLVLGVFTLYKFQIEPSRYVSSGSQKLINFIIAIEQAKAYNGGAYPVVAVADITDLSTKPDDANKAVLLWQAVTSGQTAPHLKNWDYDCVSTGTTVNAIADFSDIPNIELLNIVANQVQNNVSGWTCNTDIDNKKITCSKSNVVCE